MITLSTMMMRMMVLVRMVRRSKLYGWLRVAVRSDHSIDNGDEDGNSAGQDYMVGSGWCCRIRGGKKEAKEIMMMLMIQIDCTDTEKLHMYIPWMPILYCT